MKRFKKKMTRSNRSIAVTSLLLIFAGAALFGYQNCAGKVNFATTEGLLTSMSAEDECPNGCTDGEISSSENVQKPEVKVVLVVDNSFSMSQSQTKLARGVASLIDGLNGFAASFHLYTTSNDSGDKTVVAPTPGCERTRGGLASILPDPSCPAGTSRVLGDIYNQFSNYILKPSLTSESTFKISETATSADFALLKSALADRIAGQNGVGTNGSDSERGICTMARTVYDTGVNKIFKPDDVAVFAVISDEDDQSSLQNCFAKANQITDCTTEETQATTKTVTQTCTRPECASMNVSYKVSLGARSTYIQTTTYQKIKNPYISRKFSYQTQTPAQFKETISFNYSVPQAARDGVPQPDLIKTDGSASISSLPACTTPTSQPCTTQAEINSAISKAQNLGGTYVANSCVVSACTQTQAASSATGSKTLTYASCNALSLSQCESAIGSINNYVAGSCLALTDATNCQTITPTADPVQTYRTQEVASAAPDQACSSTTLSSVQASIPNGYSLVSGSCVVKTVAKTYAAFDKTYSIVQTPASSQADVQANSYCGTRIYQGSETLSQYATRTNNNQPVTACVIASATGPNYSTETVTVTIPPAPGTPRCVDSASQNIAFKPQSGVQPTDVSDAFVKRAQELFRTNYFVSAIVNKSSSDASCPMQPGQSVGSKYIDLAVNRTPNPGVVTSICDDNYGVALNKVSQWVVRSLNNTYVISSVNVARGDKIIHVWIERGGSARLLQPYEVDIHDQTIKILTPDIIQLGDIIKYRIRTGIL